MVSPRRLAKNRDGGFKVLVYFCTTICVEPQLQLLPGSSSIFRVGSDSGH